MKKILIGIILFSVFAVIFVTAELLIDDSGNPVSTSLTTSQYKYTGNYTVIIGGEEALWVDKVEIIDKQIIVTAKNLTDRTYEECIAYDIKDQVICLKYGNVTYPIGNPDLVNIPITKDGGVYVTSKSFIGNKMTYQIGDEHLIKIGLNSIIVIEDIISTAILEDVVYYLKITHLNISTTAPYDDLLSYVPSDINANALFTYDYSNNNNYGTYYGQAYYTPNGVYGGGLIFDGSDDGISFPDFSVGGASLPNMTMSAWVKRVGQDEANGWVQRIFDRDSARPHIRFIDEINISLDVYDGSHHYASCDNDTLNISWEDWHMVTGTWGFEGMHLYIDGIECDNDAFTGTYQYVNVRPFCIGMRCGATIQTYKNNELNGSMDEVMFFRTQLDSAEVLEVYNNQSARFKSEGYHTLYQNISGDFTAMKVTGDYLAEFGSYVELEVSYYNDTGWHSAGNQTYIGSNSYTIEPSSTNVSLNFTYHAGEGTYDFYTPHLLGDNGINLTIYNCDYTDYTGNWVVNNYCEYYTENFNIDGNTSIQDGGTMVCMIDRCNLNFTEHFQYIIYDNVADTQNKLLGNWSINAPDLR